MQYLRLAVAAVAVCSTHALLVNQAPVSLHRQELAHFQCESSSARGGIWGPPLAPHPDTSRNMCIDGKQVPDLYLLGAAKCATTSLAYELISAGTRCAGGIKEYHFFKKETLSQFPKDPASVTAQWLQGMPTCDAQNRVLMGDYSPESISYTDAPGHPANRTHEIEMPLALSQMYGPRAAKLNFVMMIREPLSRTLSFAYYHMNNFVPGKFQVTIENLLKRFTPDNMQGGRNPLWGSSYGHQLERWLTVFSHSQFYVIPYKAFGHGDAHRICQNLVARVGYGINCGSALTPVATNSGSHPSLEEVSTESFRQEFRNFMSRDFKILMRHLDKGSKNGMGLALYDGPKGDHQAIREWLQMWW